jgi:hypothetical protein
MECCVNGDSHAVFTNFILKSGNNKKRSVSMSDISAILGLL